ncbi:DUF4314 domain-containing protein [Lysinibacillus sp. UGB7]|uniref:DUF4314 domain-containing protein n=1 Tax=Lysinibacillus sp. UGB7 TaxID=3411039 RepID=UPI003B7C2B42
MNSNVIERKIMFPPGARIVVLETIEDIFTPILKDEKGTVLHVDDIGSVHTQWDNGSTLAALIEDKISLINKGEDKL